jgi:voltage-gated potassium channel
MTMANDDTRPPDVPAYMTEGLRRWRRATDGALLVIAIGSLPLLLLEFKRAQLPYADRIFLDVVNVLVLVAFAVDYAVELILATQRGIYIRKEWTSAAIVVSQAIALLPGLAGFGVLRAFRAARLFRVVAVVLRLVAVGGAAATEGRAILRRKAARFALGLAAFTWLMSAVAFTLAEDVSETGQVNSFGDALWWSAATITTVGYGDVYPVTAFGRVIGVFTMLVGISTFAVVTAKVAEFLVRSDMDDRQTMAGESQ